MKNKYFEIHNDDIIPFAEKIEELDLDCRITGGDTEADLLYITVCYERDEKELMNTLIDFVNEFDLQESDK